MSERRLNDTQALAGGKHQGKAPMTREEPQVSARGVPQGKNHGPECLRDAVRKAGA